MFKETAPNLYCWEQDAENDVLFNHIVTRAYVFKDRESAKYIPESYRGPVCTTPYGTCYAEAIEDSNCRIYKPRNKNTMLLDGKGEFFVLVTSKKKKSYIGFNIGAAANTPDKLVALAEDTDFYDPRVNQFFKKVS